MINVPAVSGGGVRNYLKMKSVFRDTWSFLVVLLGPSPLGISKHPSEAKAPHSQLFHPELYTTDTCTKPSVDHLKISQGVVLRRAATILRSIETHPLT